MCFFRIFIFILFCCILGNAKILINENINGLDILSQSNYYIDNSKTLTIEDFKKIDVLNLLSEKANKNTLTFGYSPNFNLWLKFTVKNTTEESKRILLEYGNPLTTNLEFYDPKKKYVTQKEGLFFTDENRKTITPYFFINLEPFETQTYYLKASTKITTLIVNLKIWEESQFYKKETFHQMMLALFFGAMIVLFIYNLFVYFFTKDMSYLYYVAYIFALTFHHVNYVGLSNIYLFEQETIILIIKYATVIVALPILALALFTKEFLKVEQYPLHNKVLKFLLYLIPLNLIVLIAFEDLARYRNALSLIILAFLMYLTIYALFMKNKQAKFIFLGWLIFFFAGTLMILSSTGRFNIYEYIPYFPEVSFVLEAIVFSIALSHRINILKEENDTVNKALIEQKENEKQRLKEQVDIKTQHLNLALEEREILLKELNHRVKNNMQTIVSLIRLQNDKIENDSLNEILITIQNRINAMSYLHELLYTQNDMQFINTSDYFRLICDEIQSSYNKNIDISLTASINLKIEEAMYCGLILNELITNTYKYAYPNCNDGKISILLEGNGNLNKLTVRDYGIGYKDKTNSLGLIIVESLAKRQLKGTIQINSNNGVKNIIEWRSSNED